MSEERGGVILCVVGVKSIIMKLISIEFAILTLNVIYSSVSVFM